MARQPEHESAEDRAIRELAAEDTAAIDQIARASGPPPDSERLSEAEEAAIWAITDPLVDADPDAIAQQLMTTGLDQPTLARLQVLRAHPDWAPLYGTPTQDAELAQQYAQMARYPWRWALLEHLPDPEAQAQKAESMDRRYQRAHAAMHAPLAMAPTPTPAEVPADAPPGVESAPGSASLGVWKPDGNEGMKNTFTSPPQDVRAVVPIMPTMGG